MKCTIILLLSFNFLFSQTEFNKLDSNGKKNGLWKGFFKDSERLRFEGTFNHGIEDGMFNFYDDTKAGSLIATRTFSKNGTVAENVFYDQKKFIVSKGITVNRKNEGQWYYYHRNSTDIQMIENYLNGKIHGNRKTYYLNNIIAEDANYIEGKRHGLLKIFTVKGVVIEESNFKNGIYDGFAIFRLPTGEIDTQGNYSNGERKGIWQIFRNGKVVKTEKYPKQVKFVKKKERI